VGGILVNEALDDFGGFGEEEYIFSDVSLGELL
jgi:hypothetical protein